MPAAVQIASPSAAQRAEAAALLAESLAFAPADAVPAWLMRTTDECGGLTLVALRGAQVVGVSYAMPAFDAERRCWFSCGLAVAARERGNGIARALKLEQRRRGLAAGVSVIRWTADARNVPALRLYLSVLGARVVDYRPGRHRGLRAADAADDDVDVEWRLDGAEPTVSADGAETIAFPRDGGTRAHADYAGRLRSALDRGLVGIAVDRDDAGGFSLRMGREVAT